MGFDYPENWFVNLERRLKLANEKLVTVKPHLQITYETIGHNEKAGCWYYVVPLHNPEHKNIRTPQFTSLSKALVWGYTNEPEMV